MNRRLDVCRTWEHSTALMGKRPKSLQFFLRQRHHYAPQNPKDLYALSRHARYDGLNPAGSWRLKCSGSALKILAIARYKVNHAGAREGALGY